MKARGNRAKTSLRPTERVWAMAQPHYWRRACLAFAVASNTRGGVVGKSLVQIARDARRAGIPVSLRTVERHIPLLQSYGVIYQDEGKPVQDGLDSYRQRPSTWLLRLGERMPDHVRPTSPPFPRPRPTNVEWCKLNGIDLSPLVQPDAAPF